LHREFGNLNDGILISLTQYEGLISGTWNTVRCLKNAEEYPSIDTLFIGCMDPNACNYVSESVIDPGLYPCYFVSDACNDGDSNTMSDVIDSNCQCAGLLISSGCTNPVACNYIAVATQDDGSCLIQGSSCNDGNSNTINDVINSYCQCRGNLILNGCTNPLACNYNINASQDNGSCIFPGSLCNDYDGQTINDVISSNCQCVGTLNDNGMVVPGNGLTDVDGTVYNSIIIKER
jgi:hypothetical protein